MTEATATSSEPFPTTVAQVLDLRSVSPNAFVTAPTGAHDRRGLYGGQLAAQALQAAVNTVPPDRLVHSLHSYFLVPGDATAPVTLRVERDRDGRRYSTRRVVASQRDKTVLHLSASFQLPKDGPDYQAAVAPEAEAPEQLPSFTLDKRMLDVDARVPTDPEPWHRWPTRIWVRLREPLGDDPNSHACGLTFLSDMCTGLSKAPLVEYVGVLPSLDHSLWLHRPVRVDDWLLMDLRPESTSGGRGMYTGRVYDRYGTLVASMAQESLFKIRPKSEHLPATPQAADSTPPARPSRSHLAQRRLSTEAQPRRNIQPGQDGR
ncbi:acyl-CoA thioesterase [Nocardia arizonensis]|uniref:acyl-CoA thioesterase n=1 Tax=Nocardia arizonensis TaxID=1141647 RepID=UPI000AFB0280|nr:acyl-CoA thioesterase domain-containing protein [Nocardia arizonensis]